MRDVMRIVDIIKSKKAALRFVNLVDTASPTGELVQTCWARSLSSSGRSCSSARRRA
jgi:hypothetical protein